MKLEHELNRYYKEMKKHLTCSKKSREHFITEAHRLVDDFLENQPDATYEDILKNIGTPKELSETFLNTLPDKAEIERYHLTRRRKRRLIAALLCATIVILLGIIVYIGQVRYHTVITEETTTIIYPESSS